MKRFRILAIIGILLAIVFVWGFYFYPCVKFVPLRYEMGFRGKLVAAPEFMNAEYVEGIQVVLNYYHQKYRADDKGNVFIPWRLAINEELLWNYSTKAGDKSFVKRIQGKRLGD